MDSSLPEKSHDTNHLSRRSFLKKVGKGAALITTSASIEAAVDIVNRGTLAAHYISTINRFRLRRHSSAPMDVPSWWKNAEATKITGAIQESMEAFFPVTNEGWQESLINSFKIFNIPPELGLTHYAYWGKNKIGSRGRVLREDLVYTAQTHFSTVAKNEWLRRSLEPIISSKGMINSRTYGFYDKESEVYSNAVLHSINKKQTDPDFWNKLTKNDKFFDLCQRMKVLRTNADAKRIQSNSKFTEYDDDLIMTAQDIERIIVSNETDMPMNIALTSACLSNQLDIWRDTDKHYDAYPSSIQSLLLMTTSDCYPMVFPPYFNERTDIFFPPEDTTRSAFVDLKRVFSQPMLTSNTPKDTIGGLMSLQINEGNHWMAENLGKYSEYAKSAPYINSDNNIIASFEK